MPENPENPLKPPAKGGVPSEITRENFAQVLAAAAEKLAPRPETSIARVAGRKIITGALVWPDRTLYNLAEKPEGTAQKTALELFYNLGTTPEQLAAVRQRLEENRAVSTPAGTLSPSQDSKILLNQTIDALTGFREQHQNVSRLYSFYHGRSLPTKGVQGRAAAVSGRVRRLVTKPARAVGRTLAKTGVGQAVKKGATWLATRLGLATFGNLIAPGVATIIGLAWIAFDVVKYLIKKVLDDPVKAIAAGVALLAGALLLPLPFLLKLPLLALGALGLTPLLGSLAGLTTVAGAAFVSFIVMMIPFIVAPLLTTLGIAVVVTAVVVFGLTAWFMHATTAARFLVGGAVPSAIESVYFDVEKTVSPTVVANAELPEDLVYTIRVTATGFEITNIRLVNATTKTNNSGTTTITVDRNGNPITNFSRARLARGETFETSYTIRAEGGSFQDSIIIDVASVTADVPEEGQTGETAVASAQVMIGSPPTACFEFAGPWNDIERALELQAIARLSAARAYVAALCAPGTITLQRERRDPGYGGFAADANTIVLYNRAFGWLGNAALTLAHETGHLYAWRHPASYVAYLDSGIYLPPPVGEGFLPTYRLTRTPGEDYPEMIGVYVVWSIPGMTFAGCGGCAINYPADYPLHYNFARDNLFGGFTY